MSKNHGTASGAIMLSLFITSTGPAIAQEDPMAVASGSFEVSMEPQGEADNVDGVSLTRFRLKKIFTGDLIGGSSGEMLTATTAIEGSAGYVAVERVNGSLNGRGGTFVLQHSGTMQAGNQGLSISIVPDSGTGELAGIEGTFHLRIEDGKHYYELSYSLGDE